MTDLHIRGELLVVVNLVVILVIVWVLAEVTERGQRLADRFGDWLRNS